MSTALTADIRSILARHEDAESKLQAIELLVGETLAELLVSQVTYPNVCYSRSHNKLVTVLADAANIRTGMAGECMVWDGEKLSAVAKTLLILMADQPTIYIGPEGPIEPGTSVDLGADVTEPQTPSTAQEDTNV